MKIITQIREYKSTATLGQVYVDNRFCCYTLEDLARPDGVKIPGETCIPEGCYVATVTMSPRFGREMILLRSKGEDAIIRDGVKFTGLRVHKGNSVEDTEGCILVGMETNGVDRIWNCTPPDKFLTELIKNEDQCLWVITSE